MMNPGTKASAAYKKIIPLLALAFIGTMVSVQTGRAQVRLGILGGLHSAKVLETNTIPGWDTATKPFQSSRSGFQLGLILELPIGQKGFFFQPAIAYSTKGRKYTRNYDSATSQLVDTIYTRQNLNINYIDIPLNLTYKFFLSKNHKNSFFLSAGPQISFYYNGKTTNETLKHNAVKYTNESTPLTVGKGNDTYKTLDLGINGRAGFELGSFMLSAYFSQGLTSFYNAPYEGTFHHQLAGVSVGIWLSSTKAPVVAKKVIRDTDLDGVPDDKDACPLKPGLPKYRGCPAPDTDNDGIDDDHDSCRTIQGVARYNGCPIPDTDHDGVSDEEDKCPGQAGLARYNGCPIPDRDGDSLNDEEDRCPDAAGEKDNQGCPVIKKETREQISYLARNILFNSSSDQLTDSSFLALDVLAGLMKDHPEWRLTIEGHTDNSGRADKNKVLSQKRADAVKNYLVQHGIPAANLTAIGFGSERPIASNATAASRAHNRRVELKLSQEPIK